MMIIIVVVGFGGFWVGFFVLVGLFGVCCCFLFEGCCCFLFWFIFVFFCLLFLCVHVHVCVCVYVVFLDQIPC